MTLNKVFEDEHFIYDNAAYCQIYIQRKSRCPALFPQVPMSPVTFGQNHLLSQVALHPQDTWGPHRALSSVPNAEEGPAAHPAQAALSERSPGVQAQQMLPTWGGVRKMHCLCTEGMERSHCYTNTKKHKLTGMRIESRLGKHFRKQPRGPRKDRSLASILVKSQSKRKEPPPQTPDTRLINNPIPLQHDSVAKKNIREVPHHLLEILRPLLTTTCARHQATR